MLRDLFDANNDPEYKCFFYISPYRRSKQTALGIAQAFEKRHISGVREEPQLREQDFGNFQDLKQKKAEKRERQYFGRFFYRFKRRIGRGRLRPDNHLRGSHGCGHRRGQVQQGHHA